MTILKGLFGMLGAITFFTFGIFGLVSYREREPHHYVLAEHGVPASHWRRAVCDRA